MKNLMAAAVVVVVVAVVGVVQGLPIEREPRQFVYQPGSPSVRLYPVHFDHYLKLSPDRVHLGKEGSPVMQAFGPNLVQPKMEKTERLSSEAEPMMTPTIPQVKPKTTTATTTSTTTPAVTTSDPKRTSMVTKEPMEEMTTLQPLTMEEAEEEPVTEVEKMLENESPALAIDREEPISATEIMPAMEVEEVEAATEFSHDATVTELVPENEVTTESLNVRELLDVRTPFSPN